jgi:hypothetical protein
MVHLKSCSYLKLERFMMNGWNVRSLLKLKNFQVTPSQTHATAENKNFVGKIIWNTN